MAVRPYPDTVRRYFLDPANVGPLPAVAGARRCRGEAGSEAAGTWVVLEAAVRGEVVEQLAFRAYGCPWLIAACSRVTQLLAPGPVWQLRGFDPATLSGELALPAEKLGSLLILQDALRNCFRDWDTTQPAAAR